MSRAQAERYVRSGGAVVSAHRYMSQAEAIAAAEQSPVWQAARERIRDRLATSGVSDDEIREYLALAADEVVSVPRDANEGVGAGVPSVVAIRMRAVQDWLDAHPAARAALQEVQP